MSKEVGAKVRQPFYEVNDCDVLASQQQDIRCMTIALSASHHRKSHVKKKTQRHKQLHRFAACEWTHLGLSIDTVDGDSRKTLNGK